jgi:hypothetical protein
MILMVAWGTGYSVGTVLAPTCEEHFDYGNQICGGPCFQLQPTLGTIDIVVSIFIPIPCIIFFNTFIIIRVIHHKRRMQQKNVWSKNLGMLIQLLSVSILHIIVWVPVTMVLIIALANQPPSPLILELQASWILINLAYLAVLGNPIVCMFAIPEIREKLAGTYDRIRRGQSLLRSTASNQIQPATTSAP